MFCHKEDGKLFYTWEAASPKLPSLNSSPLKPIINRHAPLHIMIQSTTKAAFVILQMEAE